MFFRAETALAEVSEEHEKNSMTAARATTVFTAEEIRMACDGFSSKKLIGRGVSGTRRYVRGMCARRESEPRRRTRARAR